MRFIFLREVLPIVAEPFGDFARLEARFLRLDCWSTMTCENHEGIHGPSRLAVWMEVLMKNARDIADFRGDDAIGFQDWFRLWVCSG